MSLFRQPASRVIDKYDVSIDGVIVINGEMWGSIPVTRYSQGMSKGLYNKESELGKFCGTFYYYEPESTTRLVYKTIKSYKNKYFAIKDLDANNEEIKKLEANVNFMDYINGVLPVDLMMSANEMLAYSNKLNRPWRHPVFN